MQCTISPPLRAVLDRMVGPASARQVRDAGTASRIVMGYTRIADLMFACPLAGAVVRVDGLLARLWASDPPSVVSVADLIARVTRDHQSDPRAVAPMEVE